MYLFAFCQKPSDEEGRFYVLSKLIFNSIETVHWVFLYIYIYICAQCIKKCYINQLIKCFMKEIQCYKHKLGYFVKIHWKISFYRFWLHQNLKSNRFWEVIYSASIKRNDFFYRFQTNLEKKTKLPKYLKKNFISKQTWKRLNVWNKKKKNLIMSSD